MAKMTAPRPDSLGEWMTAIRLAMKLDQQKIGHEMSLKGASRFMNVGRICEIETDPTKVWPCDDLSLWCEVVGVPHLLGILWQKMMERQAKL